MLASSSKRVLGASLSKPQTSRTASSAQRVSKVADVARTRALATQALPSRTWKRADVVQDSQGLRGRPWNFEPDLVKFKRGSQTTAYNLRLNSHLENGSTIAVIQKAAEMKAKNIAPDLYTYNTIIQALGINALHQEAWAAFKDMKAMGIEPDVNSFNGLILGVRYCSTDQLHNILAEMDRHNIRPNSKTYDLTISYYLEGGNLEMALYRLAEMNDLGFSPSLQIAQLLIDAAAETGHARLALDLAEAYEQTTIRRLDNTTWVKLLVACADNLYAGGVKRCWKKVVDELRILPDEGLCQSVLHTAARHGLPTLAADAIRSLETMGVKFRELHFAPLLDAFVRNGQLKEAFRTLDLMRSSNIIPKLYTAETILQSIRRDPDTIDEAYAMLEELHSEGQKVDVVAANIIIKASSFLNDLQRAAGIYKAMPSLDVQPDVDTFNLLLSACIKVKHLELGQRLFGEMQEAGLKPTETTYYRLICLVLAQADYENAFFYLEEMKAAGISPSYAVYEQLVKKCVSAGDARYNLAVEELEQMGYEVSTGLRSFIDSGGKEWKEFRPEEERLPYETRQRLRSVKERNPSPTED
ncbi:hypothetical protein M0805_008369 [Coniferiporia weirii]|nr:hypothetical protein M0805_008369 [Coniferiporia weirii]